MKKFLSLLLILVMCFTFSCGTLAADAEEDSGKTEAYSIQENTGVAEAETAENADEDLEGIVSAASKVVTLIYDYATKPEEPAVDLETVLTIVQIVIYVAYTIMQNI